MTVARPACWFRRTFRHDYAVCRAVSAVRGAIADEAPNDTCTDSTYNAKAASRDRWTADRQVCWEGRAVFTVMSWNVENFFAPKPADQAAYDAKVASLAKVITTATPDLLAL